MPADCDRHHAGLTRPPQLDRMLKLMRSHFPQALIHGAESLVQQFVGRIDTKDEHVAGGALNRSKACRAGSSCAGDPQRQLPAAGGLCGHQSSGGTPGRFLAELVNAEPGVPAVIDRMLKRFRKPKTTRVDLLNIMVNADCREFAAALAAARESQPG